MDFDVLFGAKLEWEMDKYSVPKGIQKTMEKWWGVEPARRGSWFLLGKFAIGTDPERTDLTPCATPCATLPLLPFSKMPKLFRKA